MGVLCMCIYIYIYVVYIISYKQLTSHEWFCLFSQVCIYYILLFVFFSVLGLVCKLSILINNVYVCVYVICDVSAFESVIMSYC